MRGKSGVSVKARAEKEKVKEKKCGGCKNTVSPLSFCFLILILVSVSANAQNGNLGDRVSPLALAVAQGNKLMQKNNFRGALQLFQQAYKGDTANSNLNYKIGYCYNKLGKDDSAVAYLERAIKNVSKLYDGNSQTERSAPTQAYYILGSCQQNLWHFSPALKAFKAYKPLVPASDKQAIAELSHRITQCNTARMYFMAPSNAKIINLGDSINTKGDDYNPVIQQDGSSILFTSGSHDGGTKIYISYSKPDSSWRMAKPYSPALSTFFKTSCLSLSPDGQTIMLLCNDGKSEAIYQSQLGENDWDPPQKAGADINLAGKQSGACMSPDGNTLFFVSERPGGIGGKDIWRCVKLPNGSWSKALNLGEPINTPYNEESPFVLADGRTFFYSSEGRNSMGGYDIFFSQLNDSGRYSEPFNLGYPINTPANELHFSLTADGKKGFMNSDRPGGKGGMDIYFVVMPHASERPLTIIKGQILPSAGESLSDDVHIVATDNVTNQEVGDFKPIKSTGRFTVIVPPGRSYTLSYLDDDREFYREVINVPADAGYKEIHKELTLNPHPIKGNTADTTRQK